MEPFKRFTMTRRDCRWWKSKLLLDGRRLEMLMELRVGFVIDFVFCSLFEKVGFFWRCIAYYGSERFDAFTWDGMAWHGMA